MVRGVVAAAVAAIAPLAGAHEFTCSEVVGIVQVDASGLPVIGWNALPVYASEASRVFTLHAYPATVGFRVALRDVAPAVSAVTGAADAFTAGLTEGVDYARYGLQRIGPGLSLPAGTTAYEELAFRVASQEDCLRRFGAGPGDAPVCADTGEDRFVVTNDVGSTECRARIVCGAPGPQPPPSTGPVPPPSCAGAWGGVKQFGTANFDGANGLALDAQCGVHVAGETVVHPAPSTATLWSLAADGTPAGSVALGTGGGDFAAGVALDGAGNRYVGWTDTSAPNDGDVTKLAPDGSILWTVHAIDGPVEGIAADVAGDAYVVGTNPAEHAMAFAKLGPDGAVLWSVTGLAAGGDMGGLAVALSPGGEVLFAGYGIGAPGEQPDAFVKKLDAQGHLVWARFIGTEANDVARGVAGDAAGNVYVGGITQGAFPGYTSSPGSYDGFVAKLDPEANLLWVRQLGAQAAEVYGVATDRAGNVWAVGTAASALGGQSSLGQGGAFVVKFDPAGDVVFVREFGTASVDTAYGVAIDAGGDAFVCGATAGDLGGALGGQDAFVAKFDPLGNLL